MCQTGLLDCHRVSVEASALVSHGQSFNTDTSLAPNSCCRSRTDHSVCKPWYNFTGVIFLAHAGKVGYLYRAFATDTFRTFRSSHIQKGTVSVVSLVLVSIRIECRPRWLLHRIPTFHDCRLILVLACLRMLLVRCYNIIS